MVRLYRGPMIRTLITAFCLIALSACASAPAPIRVLIVEGVNNHDWQPASAAVTDILSESGRFEVSISRTPARDAPAAAWDAWRPRFNAYDVVLSNFNGGHTDDGVQWPAPVRDAFETYVRNGGGFVSLHAANNAFLGWTAYEDMVGLLWRDAAFGPSVIFDAAEQPVIVPASESRGPGHGPRHDFEMTLLPVDHPITRGLPKHWIHPAEQLTHGQHGHEATVHSDAITYLTYAWSSEVNEREPMDWVRHYGRGRVYVTMLGHTWAGEENPNLDAPGFRTLLARGVEWAGSGRVTLPAPANLNVQAASAPSGGN